MFRLAGHLGATVAELERRLSADELIEWLAFDQLSPIGQERDDLLHSFGMSLLANCHSRRKYKPKHFLPKWGAEKRGSTPAEIRAWFQSLKERT